MSKPRPAPDLQAHCHTCKEQVAMNEHNVLHVRRRDYRAVWNWEREQIRTNDGWQPLDLSTVPDKARWEVLCMDCRDDDHDCHGCYWFSLDRIKDWAGLINRASHLGTKDWIGCTDWASEVLRHATSPYDGTTGISTVLNVPEHA